MSSKHEIDQLFEKLKDSESKEFLGKEPIWNKIEKELNHKPKGKSFSLYSPRWVVAASIVVLFSVMTWFVMKDTPNGQNATEQNQVELAVSDSKELLNESTEEASEAEWEEAEMRKTYADVLIMSDSTQTYAYQDKSNAKKEWEDLAETHNLGAKEKQRNRNLDQMTIENSPPEIHSPNTIYRPKYQPESKAKESRQMTPQPVNSADEFGYQESAEIVMSDKVMQQAEEDYYFIDGEAVTQKEMQEYEMNNVERITYLSNTDAANEGYIFIPLKKNKKEVLYWKNLKLEKLKQNQKEAVLAQLKSMNSDSLSQQEMKLLQSMIQQLEAPK